MADLTALLSNLNTDAGGCPAPFIAESRYPFTDGYYGGRNCAANPLDTSANASRCCIPCPIFDWTYDDNFKRLTDGAAWVNVVGFILCGFLLISMVALPTTASRRSYLNIILLAGLMLLELGFIIPLARQPEQCFDPITPNDMHSNLTCAFSGAFAAFGGMAVVTWIVIRALFMHLQVVHNFTPGTRSYIAANVLAWSVTIGLTAAVLAHSGVSFRFGGYCHVNVGSISTYWGWLLGFGGIAFLLQLATLAYCIKVYLTAAIVGRQALGSSSNKSSMGGSSRSRTAFASLRRLKTVLALQWRSVAIVILAIFTTSFVCVVFIVLDNSTTLSAFANVDILIPWLLCIIGTQDKNKCLQYTGPFIIPQRIVDATLYILAFVGIEAFLLMVRVDIFKGWWAFIRNPLGRRRSRPDSTDTFVTQPIQRFEVNRGSTILVQSPRGAEMENRKSMAPVSPVEVEEKRHPETNV
ncbi:hypothetical protein AC578_6364 [Lecanosticta acicola]|uniref:G-protein coupled receptors family 2 profile 2 domain-containing protein n=1 Tax=Lecanosticta acicola TaxID=111012 RepID=A0AAI8Z862_9PEZI|nr:hypothetical protein AC578_6364 [Lecanosticta acicola]